MEAYYQIDKSKKRRKNTIVRGSEIFVEITKMCTFQTGKYLFLKIIFNRKHPGKIGA